MAIRKKGRSIIEVNGRSFVYWVHDEQEVRIASTDKRFVVAFRWIGDPLLTVSGQEFPDLSASEPRPVFLRPPAFVYRSPAGLARHVIRGALYSGHRELQRIPAEPDAARKGGGV